MESDGKHILSRYDEDLQKLRQGLAEMGSLVQEQLQACFALLEGGAASKQLISGVLEREATINLKELELSSDIVACFCRHQPVASDVRICISYMRMSLDIERIGDEIEHVATGLASLRQTPARDGAIGGAMEMLLQMNRGALNRALDSLKEVSEKEAKQVIDRDVEINAQHFEIQALCVQALKNDEVDADDFIHLLQASRALERVGDHSKNLSQAVIYAATGEDLRLAEVIGKAKHKDTTN